MDPRAEPRSFLATRRARLFPQEVGLTAAGRRRRVPGLRREEVALLAGVSAEYYTRLERGRAGGVSDTVLDDVGEVLRLDDVERSHLRRLARSATTGRRASDRPATAGIRPSLQWLLDAIEGAPAFIRDGRLNLLGANELGRRLYSPHFDSQQSTGEPEGAPDHAPGAPNIARFVFLDERAPAFYTDWDKVAGDIVATMHAEAGRVPGDRGLLDLVVELCTGNPRFRGLWETQDVMEQRAGVLRLHHPDVGDLEVCMEATPLAADPGLTLVVLPVAPHSPAARTLGLLRTAARKT